VRDADADHIVRALQARTDSLRRAATFVQAERDSGGDGEARVWVEADSGPICVSVTWEPGHARFGFYVMDGMAEERLACIRIPGVPTLSARKAIEPPRDFVEAAMRATVERDAARDLLANAVLSVDIVDEARFDHGVTP